ncbi:glycosyltransferase family 39 protein [Tersicoccus sp. MR15.9]|uniref:ArnT family glycosyltransferase n=1 Tax=Tersicoccus mangrovi TaxID=3121635 RepID=UPI002FE69BB6
MTTSLAGSTGTFDAAGPGRGTDAHADDPAGSPSARRSRRTARRVAGDPGRTRLARGASRLGSRVRPTRQTWPVYALLVATAVLYLAGLDASGWANPFYSAAAQAGSQNFTAFLFGSSDAANAITVDKPPASLWFMAISVKLFGLNSFAILLPQALMGVAAVGTVYAAVTRVAGRVGGLIGGAALAVTPVATLMFRFNNPDALLVLLLSLAAYATVRSIQSGRARWLIACGVLIGFAFLTKQLQALLVVPGFGLVYLVAAPHRVGRRLLHLLGAMAALVVSAGWWIALVELTPAQYRPYIGGTQTNSILELTFGYNGFGRLTGDEVGSVGGGGATSTTGLWRMFSASFGGQISWLLPAALVLMIAALWMTRRAPRTDPARAALLVWGSWLLVTGLVFSLMAGIIHEYYSVALAPAIAAVVGISAGLLWSQRDAGRPAPVPALLLGSTVMITAFWAYILLARTPTFLPWLRWVVLFGGMLAGVGLVMLPHLTRPAGRAVAAVAVVLALAGPASYAVQTASTGHTGAIVTAGPSTGMGFGGRGGMAPGGAMPQGMGQTGAGQTGAGQTGAGQATGQQAGPGGQGGAGGMGGLLNATTPGTALVAALTQNAGTYTWAAAVVGSNNAAGYQLATGLPVMAVGGFNGTDPAPTLAQFQQLVKEGKIHYWIAGTIGMQANGGSDAASQIDAWVQATYTATTIDGVTVYDLTS